MIKTHGLHMNLPACLIWEEVLPMLLNHVSRAVARPAQLANQALPPQAVYARREERRAASAGPGVQPRAANVRQEGRHQAGNVELVRRQAQNACREVRPGLSANLEDQQPAGAVLASPANNGRLALWRDEISAGFI